MSRGSRAATWSAGRTQVFAHASVRIESGDARSWSIAYCGKSALTAAESTKQPNSEARHRQVLLWLLGPSSPIRGNACVHLTDTRFFVLARVVDVLLSGEPVQATACPGQYARTRPMAITLYRSGEPTYRAHRWQEFLTLAANLFEPTTAGCQDARTDVHKAVEEMARVSTALMCSRS